MLVTIIMMKEKLTNLLHTEDLVLNFIILAVFLVLALVTGKVISVFFARAARLRKARHKNTYNTFLKAISRSVIFLLVAMVYGIAIKITSFPPSYHLTMHTVFQILLTLSIGYLAFNLVTIPVIWYEDLVQEPQSGFAKMFIPALKTSLRTLVAIGVIFQFFQILTDKPLTSMIAGLGIGGLAVALAAQDTLKHFIGSFVIAGDKPFEIGDRVVVDGHDGPIEAIGLRSTKIRTLNGHLVSIPNGELANRTIQNIGKRPYIKHEGNITITYETPPEKIREALAIVKDLLHEHEGFNEEFPPRVNFNRLNSDSLNIFYLYWYHPPTYWEYMDFNERLNFQLIERFAAAGIEFAYPTQKIFMAKEEN